MTSDAVPTSDNKVIIARPASYYRITRIIMFVVLVGYGIWCVRDGFYAWPKENAEAERQGIEKVPHNHWSIWINQGCAVALPPLGFFVLGWALYSSRGAYRLAGKVLSVPGHPDIPLDAIQAINKSLWDKKGIAVVEYQLTNPAVSGKATLDDFVYEREPTDAIFDELQKALLGAPAATPAVKPATAAMKLPPRPRIGR